MCNPSFHFSLVSVFPLPLMKETIHEYIPHAVYIIIPLFVRLNTSLIALLETRSNAQKRINMQAHKECMALLYM